MPYDYDLYPLNQDLMPSSREPPKTADLRTTFRQHRSSWQTCSSGPAVGLSDARPYCRVSPRVFDDMRGAGETCGVHRVARIGSEDWTRFCAANGLDSSMSRRGNCWDNAVAEFFLSSLKKERIQKRIYKTRDLARADIFDSIEVFSNRTRRLVTSTASVRSLRKGLGVRRRGVCHSVGSPNAAGRPHTRTRSTRAAPFTSLSNVFSSRRAQAVVQPQVDQAAAR